MKQHKSNHPLYKTYMSMMARCYNPERPEYKNYGGRGIKVCKEWIDDFWTFAQDIRERPENTTLNRIDNNKGYFADNCEWANKSAQQANRRYPGKRLRGVKANGNQFLASVMKDGVRHYCGNHRTEIEAHAAYIDKFIKLFGFDPPVGHRLDVAKEVSRVKIARAETKIKKLIDSCFAIEVTLDRKEKWESVPTEGEQTLRELLFAARCEIQEALYYSQEIKY